MESEDGVKREGLDYRAGYVEGLQAFLTALQFAALRASRKAEPGLKEAHALALQLRTAMLQKMKGGES